MRIDEEARDFAIQAHEGQVRKFSGRPYICHPARVAQTVTLLRLSDIAIAAAWLHDTVEDTEVTHERINELFGRAVAQVVFELTNPPHSAGNRAERKAMTCERLAAASDDAQTIKMADMLDNYPDIRDNDPDFARAYRHECLALFEVVKGANYVIADILEWELSR